MNILIISSVASMIDQFNMPNIQLLLNMGYHVHVACNFIEGNTCDDRRIEQLKKTLSDMDVPYHQWDCPRNLSSPVRCFRAYRQLWQLLGQYHFHWLHCHSPVGGALARIAAHKRGVRIIYTAHGFHFYEGAPWKNWIFYYPAELLLSYLTDILITVNKEDYCFAKRKLRAGNIFYIPGIGIDTEYFKKQPQLSKKQFCKKFGLPDHAQILLSVGELSKRKNHQVVLEAMAQLQRQDLYYFICGQGPLQKELIAYADKLHVRNHVRMLGFLDHLAFLYQNADIFVFPSLQEGMPVALMEAMAAGLPCIVSNIRGSRELVDQPGGVMFSLNQPEQLVGALTKLLEDKMLRQKCGSYNQEKIRAYDRAVVLAKMENIYQKCMDRPSEKEQVKVLHVLKSNRYSGAENVAVTICRNCGTPYQAAYASKTGEITKWMRQRECSIRYYPMEKLNVRELHRVLGEYQPDIVHAHDFTAAVLCAVVKENFCLLSHLHNNPPWIRKWSVRSICYRLAMKRIDRMILVSDAIRKEAVFLQHIPTMKDHQLIIVGNPMDVARIRMLSQQKVADGVADLLFVGRLTEQKAPEKFLEIVFRLIKSGVTVRAVMLGDGEGAKYCRYLIKKYHLESVVSMKGFVANPYPYIRQAKLLVMTSKWEGYGLAAAEAIVLGTPVLASRVGGLMELFADFPCALCGSRREFVSKAKKLLQNQQLYEKYRQEMQQKTSVLDLETYMKRILNIYGEVYERFSQDESVCQGGQP